MNFDVECLFKVDNVTGKLFIDKRTCRKFCQNMYVHKILIGILSGCICQQKPFCRFNSSRKIKDFTFLPRTYEEI